MSSGSVQIVEFVHPVVGCVDTQVDTSGERGGSAVEEGETRTMGRREIGGADPGRQMGEMMRENVGKVKVFLGLCVFCNILLLTSTHAASMTPKAIMESLFGSADVIKIPCPDSIKEADYDWMVCGEHTSAQFSRFKSGWEIGVLRLSIDDQRIEAATAWSRSDGTTYDRTYRIGNGVAVVIYGNGAVAFGYLGSPNLRPAPKRDGPPVASKFTAVPDENGVYIAGVGGVTSPVEISKQEPKYPRLAREAGVEGKVFLVLVIDSSGTPTNIETLAISPDERLGFNAAAIDAVSQWRYRPALLDGKSVAVHTNVVVAFTIQ